MFFHQIRNAILGFGYRNIFKPFIFCFDPEDVHDSHVNCGKRLKKTRFGRALTHLTFHYSHPILEQTVAGLHFKSPIGLSAGFDKNAELLELMPHMGFGFEEAGSITGEPCEGNPKPRLWRHPDQQSIRVYYGLKNDGAEAIAPRIQKVPGFVVGLSVAKTNNQATCELTAGLNDHLKSLRALAGKGDYFTLNLSCPNTFDPATFMQTEKLEKLLTAVDALQLKEPIFLKIPPDLTEEQVDSFLRTVQPHKVDGLIITNLTKKHQLGVGGLSGKAVENLSDALLAQIYQKTSGRYVLMGCGGVFSAEDAYRKIRLGASLVQVITGMIYRGPTLVSDINIGLVRLLKRDGFRNIAEAVGIDKK